jgi:hypothetical protein
MKEIQLNLFEPVSIKEVCLIVPDSPGQTFYNIRMEVYHSQYTSKKKVEQEVRFGINDHGYLISLRMPRNISNGGSRKKQTGIGNHRENTG